MIHPNLRQFAKNSMRFTASDVSLVLERVHSHALKPRMTSDEFIETVHALGFESVAEFADHIGLPHRTAQSWARFGLARDSAQLLLTILKYRQRVETAITDIDGSLRIGLADFFRDHDLP
jgi:hypothetical protein